MNELYDKNGELMPGKYSNALQETSTSIIATQQREIEQIKAQMFLSRQFPRDITNVKRRVLSACERKSMAEVSEYSYKRGTTEVTGPTIKLLEMIASKYGNITFGHREIERSKTKAKVKAFAWDLETNTYSETEFEVPLQRTTKNGVQQLTDERDINELISNWASRRKRKMLETIIDSDIIEDAISQCRKTLLNGIDIQANIDRCLDYLLDTHKVQVTQVEVYFGKNRSAFNSTNYTKLAKICNSLRDGLSKAEDFFPSEETNVKNTKEAQKIVEKTAGKKDIPTTPTPPTEVPKSQALKTDANNESKVDYSNLTDEDIDNLFKEKYGV